MLKAKIKHYQSLLVILFLLFIGCEKGQESNQKPTKEVTNAETVLFLGNSLTAGYGLDPSEAYPALIEAKIQAANLPYTVSNAGISGSTSHDGLNRVDWYLESKPAVLVLALGANDGLRGIDPSVTKENLRNIILRARKSNLDMKILLLGMMAPPNMGRPFIQSFNAIYPSLAKDLKVELVPFLLEGVAAVPNLNLPDGIHPNQEGQKIMAETVWKKLKSLLNRD